MLIVNGKPPPGNHLLFTEAPRTHRVQFPSLASKTNLLLSAPGEEHEALQPEVSAEVTGGLVEPNDAAGGGAPRFCCRSSAAPTAAAGGSGGSTPAAAAASRFKIKGVLPPGGTACGHRHRTLRLRSHQSATDERPRGFRLREGGAPSPPRRRGHGPHLGRASDVPRPAQSRAGPAKRPDGAPTPRAQASQCAHAHPGAVHTHAHSRPPNAMLPRGLGPLLGPAAAPPVPSPQSPRPRPARGRAGAAAPAPPPSSRPAPPTARALTSRSPLIPARAPRKS